MKIKPSMLVLNAAVAACITALIGFSATGLSQGQPPTSVQGVAKPKAAATNAYRKLNPEKDGLDSTVSDISFWAKNGGASMEMTIGGITFKNSSGQELQVALASKTVSGGQVRTVNFGIMHIKVPDATTPTAVLYLTNDQIRQIKKKLEVAASGK